VKTIVLGGIATNFGVESTGRDAFERGYALVFVEDAMAGVSAEAHAFACQTIFPRLGRVRSTQAVLDGLRSGAA
jgi:nicotinamidase-related amidase